MSGKKRIQELIASQQELTETIHQLNRDKDQWKQETVIQPFEKEKLNTLEQDVSGKQQEIYRLTDLLDKQKQSYAHSIQRLKLLLQKEKAQSVEFMQKHEKEQKEVESKMNALNQRYQKQIQEQEQYCSELKKQVKKYKNEMKGLRSALSEGTSRESLQLAEVKKRQSDLLSVLKEEGMIFNVC